MKAHPPDPVKLLVGALFPAGFEDETLVRDLEKRFGPVDFRSETLSFDATDYYEPEMGAGLLRRFYAFERLVDPGGLAEIKRATNDLEDRYLEGERRTVNLDPGYLDLMKLVLASAKYGWQKIYVGGGIYADPTLYYRKGSFHPFEWGFPDFRSGIYNGILLEIRRRYRDQWRLWRDGKGSSKPHGTDG